MVGQAPPYAEARRNISAHQDAPYVTERRAPRRFALFIAASPSRTAYSPRAAWRSPSHVA